MSTVVEDGGRLSFSEARLRGPAPSMSLIPTLLAMRGLVFLPVVYEAFCKDKGGLENVHR